MGLAALRPPCWTASGPSLLLRAEIPHSGPGLRTAWAGLVGLLPDCRENMLRLESHERRLGCGREAMCAVPAAHHGKAKHSQCAQPSVLVT